MEAHNHAHDEHEHPHARGHNHHHHAGHHHAGASVRALAIACTMTVTILIAEVVGGIVSGSLALLSDAAHMLSDAAGLILALVASWYGQKQASGRATYGNKRFEVLAAFINAVVVLAISVWIIVRAIMRFMAPEPEVHTGVMLVVAVVGLLANVVSAIILNRSASDSMNVKGALLHVLSDLLGSVAVIVAGLIIQFTGFTAADSIASLVIAVIIVPRATSLVFSSAGVLVERAPETVSVKAVRQRLSVLPGVVAVHDLHVWSLDGESLLATCHVVADGPHHPVLDAVHSELVKMGIDHSTIQMETPDHVKCEGELHP
ncbi:cation transporter [Corynebacterium glucuronolyticum]|nr:cation transporter [Corynebacterium glucuronolyticum]